jgi:hypothetical protein
LDASLAIKLGNFINLPVDLSPLKMLHAGKGYVMGKETKDGVSTITAQYLETEGGSRYHLTITPLAIYGEGPKVQQGNKVVAPEDSFNSAKHSAITLKERLQEGFANGWAEEWHSLDF